MFFPRPVLANINETHPTMFPMAPPPNQDYYVNMETDESTGPETNLTAFEHNPSHRPATQSKKQLHTDEASGSRGTVSAEATPQPELADNLRRSSVDTVNGTHKSVKTRSPAFPDLPRGSRGPVGADVIGPPELADYPRHPGETGRGTDKGALSYSPMDDAGYRKLETDNGTQKDENTYPPYNEETEDGNNNDTTNFTVAPSSLPQMGPLYRPTSGRALSGSTTGYPRRSARIRERSSRAPPSETLKIPYVLLTALVGLETTNAEAYDSLHRKRYGPAAVIKSSTSAAYPPRRTATSPSKINPRIDNTHQQPTEDIFPAAPSPPPQLPRDSFGVLVGTELMDAEAYDRLQQLRYDTIAAILPSTSAINDPRLTTNYQKPTATIFPAAPSSLPRAGLSNETSLGGAMSGSVSSQTDSGTASRTKLILQWNINGLHNNISDLEILTRVNPPIILAIQEIHRSSVEQLNRTLAGRYKWTYKCGQNIYHSVAIGVLVPIPFTVVQLNTGLPIIAIRIEYPFPASVINFYLPCEKIANLRNQIIQTIEAVAEPRICLGDANGHHLAWGSPSTNARGSCIMDAVENLDLVLLNDGSITYSSGPRTSAIDISLASPSIVNKLLWHAEDDPLGSDHHPINIYLPDSPPESSRRPRWLYDQADWMTFDKTITEHLDRNPPNNITEFTAQIHQAASIAIPRTSPNCGRKSLHWWSPETKAAVKARRKALRIAKRLPDSHPEKAAVLERYRGLRNECRQVIRDAKQKSWSNFIDGINANQNPTELWGRINALSGRRKAQGLAINHQGTLTRDPNIIANALGEYFAALSAHDQYDNAFIKLNGSSADAFSELSIPDDSTPLAINEPFSLKELEFALARGKGKSAGPDDIGYPLLKHLPLEGKATLLSLLNKEWLNRSIPADWNHSLVVPIPKRVSQNLNPSDFRPISLTCCTSKVLERVVNRRLMRYLEDNNLLDHRQHAFRPGHGTGSYFTTLGQVVHEAKEADLHTEVATLDLAKAYNRAWTPGVIRQLSNWGLAGNILHFLRNFLSNRTFQVCIGNHCSRHFREETGIPQGSVIAVTIFLVAMNGVFVNLPKEIYIFVYADDIVLVVVGSTQKALRIKLQAAVSAVTRWAKLAGFQLSPEKSAISHFCSSRHRPLRTTIKSNDTPIPYKSSLRILGVRMDRHLTYLDHMKEVRHNCKSRLNLLRTISRRHETNNREVLLRVASAIVVSRLTYGIELTYTAADTMILRLGPVYNQCVRIASGLLPSTPAEAACVEGGKLPFERMLTETICSRVIAHCEKTTPVNGGLLLLDEANKLLQKFANQVLPPVAEVHWNGARGWNLPDLRFDSTIKNGFRAGDNSLALTRSVTELLRTKYDGHVKRYTDGSKTRDKVGIGISDPETATFHRLPDICSIFSAEAAAIIIAATTPSTKPIAILSDSASVISALSSYNSRHPWIQAIQQQSLPNTVFIWIPGHCGIHGNTMADHLAALGRQAPLYTKEVPGQDTKQWVKTILRTSWAAEWRRRRDPFIRKIKDDTERWEDPPKHREQQVLSRLRTGHTRISHSMGGGEPFRRTCPVCGIRNSVEHFLLECPQYQSARILHDIPGSIKDALSNEPTITVRLLCFLKDTNLYNDI